MRIKKGDSHIIVVFKGKPDTYVDKLRARNIELEGGVLKMDFSHYSRRRRNDLADSDFDLLQKMRKKIAHLLISDATVLKALRGASISSVQLLIDDEAATEVRLTQLDADGYLR